MALGLDTSALGEVRVQAWAAPEKRHPRIGIAGDALVPCPPQEGKPQGPTIPIKPRQSSNASSESKGDSESKAAGLSVPSSPASTADTLSGRSTPGTQRRGSEAGSSWSQQWAEPAVARVPTPCRARSRQGREPARSGAAVAKARYDVLTIRQWFNAMDVDHSGHVTKQEWFDFIRANPKLRHLLIHGEKGLPTVIKDRSSDETAQVLKQESKELRRLLNILRALDVDGSGTLEFEEFLEFFRRSGNLLEYGSDDHPRARLAAIVGFFHSSPNMVNDALVEEFQQLSKWNVRAPQRRPLEAYMLQHVRPQSTAVVHALHLSGRSPSVEAPARPARPETPRHRRAHDCVTLGSRVVGFA
mmetsp:Transcript_90947/g.253066  ORF Transcript_90947/g.253066 Transcript_90947/m.253066 type:complete len:358 (-) Transcript_90947:89-1162(-)|eukprot:CAMPEP_0179060598 /NCGR_PEP_ID=MMETSP0796-20121207/25948_1 /TAXON_ID=73915 /ORGANISM="Pyrodinium bahamense, Strain pbaha01" /LENGTH=357 /DNA_ID=CAMNT_0020757385 /DNA_START=49 /DNA_END=1122 /DNA_ORIENTATION=-